MRWSLSSLVLCECHVTIKIMRVAEDIVLAVLWQKVIELVLSVILITVLNRTHRHDRFDRNFLSASPGDTVPDHVFIKVCRCDLADSVCSRCVEVIISVTLVEYLLLLLDVEASFECVDDRYNLFPGRRSRHWRTPRTHSFLNSIGMGSKICIIIARVALSEHRVAKVDYDVVSRDPSTHEWPGFNFCCRARMWSNSRRYRNHAHKYF